MAEGEISAIMAQFEQMNARHKITSYITYTIICVVLLFSLIGFYMVFGKIQDQSELTKKLEATQEQISGLTDIIKENNKQISTLQQQVAESVKNQAVINAKYEALRASVNKPLPQPQQDLFFASRGFVPSYYQSDGGRAFGPEATVKLQTTLVDAEKCTELSKEKDNQIAKQTTLIDTYKTQVDNYVQVDGLRQEEFKIVDTELKKTQKELRREKIKKWVWTCVGVSVAGYAGYHVGHN